MSDDWLTELQKLREEDEAKRQAELDKLDLSVISRQNQTAQILRDSDAHNLLRKVQKVLLNGKGIIDIFDRTKQYDRAIALIWQGPISNARIPKPDDPDDYHYILVGAKGGNLYVNGRCLKGTTPETLKSALVWASKNPMKQSNHDDN
jgi:hypothetical protein